MKHNRTVLYYYTGALIASIALPLLLVYFLFIVAGMGDEQTAALIQTSVFAGSTAIFILLWPIASTVYCKRKQVFDVQDYINTSFLRYTIAFLMFFYGFSKMAGKFFDITYLAQDTRLADVDSFLLTWYYFGKSNTQEFIIGLLEFVPAILLLFRRSAGIGALLLLPVSLNVMMVNIFNHISGITFIVSIVVAIGNVYLLFVWKDAIMQFLKAISLYGKPVISKVLNIARIVVKTIILGGIGFVFIGMIMAHFRKPDTRYMEHNKIVGGFELDSLRINNMVVTSAQSNKLFYKSIYLEPQKRWNSAILTGKKAPARYFTVLWNAANDSVVTYLKKEHDVAKREVDSATKFRGTYIYKTGKLYVNGIIGADTIKATYNKKELKDYKWFW